MMVTIIFYELTFDFFFFLCKLIFLLCYRDGHDWSTLVKPQVNKSLLGKWMKKK